MSGICDKCKRESCRMKWDGLEYCGFYERGETRYERLLGTPERAARTLESIPCGNSPCSECPIFEPCLKERTKSNALLDWLRGDAE